MSNSHDEIKRLMEASRKMLSNSTINEDINRIREKHGIVNEQVDLTDDNILKKTNIAKDVEDKIEDDTNTPEDKSQGYRVVGGIIVLHGKENSDLDLTTDEKIAFQETMNEFVEEEPNQEEIKKVEDQYLRLKQEEEEKLAEEKYQRDVFGDTGPVVYDEDVFKITKKRKIIIKK